MRLSLEESKSQLQKLRNKVENLQEEVTRKKHLQNRPFLLEPSVVAVSIDRIYSIFNKSQQLDPF